MSIFLILVAAIAAWAVWTYNRLIALRNQVQNAWKQIDVQLKRRHDLIPNLVAAVKGAMDFERDTLERVVAARSRAVAAPSVPESIAAEGELSRALRQLFAVVENYPTLRANETVLHLQEELTTTENQLGFARQFYNDVAMRFNTQQEVFPASVIATYFGFQRADFFTTGEDDRAVPQVDLSLRPEPVNFYEHQRRNRRYTALLIGCFVLLFGAVGAGLDVTVAGYGVGGSAFPYLTVVALLASAAVTLLGHYRGTDWVMASLLAEPLRGDDPEHRALEHIATEMAIASGLPRPRLFVIPDPSPNALAAGRDPAHAAIAVTAGALALLDREETQGVVAHEMAHIANRDTLVMTTVAVLFGGIVMLSDWARRSLYVARERQTRAHPLLLVLAVGLVLVSPLFSRLLAMAVSRRREYQADATAVEFTRNSEGLARALEKISSSPFPLRSATRGTAHLFIVSPLRRRADERDGAWASLFATHPPLAQRIALLRGMAG